MKEKPEVAYYVNTGIYIVEPEFLCLIPDGKPVHMTQLIELAIRNEKKVGTYVIDENRWMDMGQIETMQAGGQEILLDRAGQEELVRSLPFLPALTDSILANEAVGGYAGQGLEAFASYISHAVSEQIVILLAYFATFLAVFFVLRVIVLLLNVLEHLPLLHGINKLAGLIFGLAEGLLAVWLLGLALTMAGTTGLGQSAARCIGESSFLTAIYGNNLLQQIIFWSVG